MSVHENYKSLINTYPSIFNENQSAIMYSGWYELLDTFAKKVHEHRLICENNSHQNENFALSNEFNILIINLSSSCPSMIDLTLDIMQKSIYTCPFCGHKRSPWNVMSTNVAITCEKCGCHV